MPPYIRKLEQPRCLDCEAKATHEVFNGVNATLGKYCARHAALRLARMHPAGKGH